MYSENQQSKSTAKTSHNTVVPNIIGPLRPPTLFGKSLATTF